ALGGIFSTLSAEMMTKRTHVLLKQMKDQGRLPNFPDGSLVPVILTGLEALSRERDVTRAMQAAEITRAFLATDESASNIVRLDKILGRAFVGLGFPDSVRSEAEAAQVAEEKAQSQMQRELLTKVAPGVAQEAVKQGGKE